MRALVAGELDDAAVRREVAAEDCKAARRLERVVAGDDHLLTGPLERAVCDLLQRPPVDTGRLLVDETAAHELTRDERNTAGLEEIGRDVAAARLDVGDDRRARRD